MFFQGRGNVHLAEVVDGIPGPYKIHICPDTFSVDLAVDRWEHINKCGAQDVPDASGDRASSGTVNFSFANVEDANYALTVLGTVTPGSTGSISGETLPNNIAQGDIYFLGGNQRHRGITGLVIGALVAGTDYTLDATTGAVVFLADVGSPAPDAAYNYNDPQSVSMLTAASKTYSVMFEHINKQNSNRKGSVELYLVRFSPAGSMDYMTDEAQIPALSGTALADTTRPYDDTEFGQFGRRI